jgi:CheY-like chemotaxis protein
MAHDTSAAKTILIVEDDDTARQSLSILLQEEGYRVVTAGDGQPALEYLRDHAPPDLILLDMLLPVCDGWRFLKERRSMPLFSPVPVVIMTTIDIVSREWAVAHGCAGLVKKPIAVPILLAEIRRCLDPSPQNEDIRPMPAMQRPPCRSLRVLVVEDSADARESLALLVKLNGHVVFQVGDGEAGLALARELPPDVAFLDIGLPGMSGNELARCLRELPLPRKPCLVAVTAYDQPEDRARTREAGFALHLAKPVEPSLLESVLRAVACLQLARA